MNLNNPQAMGIPRQNPAFPMAQLRDNPSGGLYNYNQPTEVIGGYDAKINPMTGQEIPQVNFAGGGLASLLESKGRRGDTMLVHMAPEEVRGLQALALAHGGTLTVNPETGLYEASFLKKLLPTIIGAIVPSVPGLGTLAKTIGFGNTALGTSLLVGGASALIEGDLKKGLEAGLGAYSGANISESLRAASVAAAPGTVAPEEMAKYQRSLGDAAAKKELMGLTDTAPLQSSQGISSVPYRPIDLGARLKDQITSRMPSLGNAAGLANLGPIDTGPVAPAAQPSIMGGIRGLFTSPEARTAFGQALGGGFQSPLMQNIAKTATFSGIANALSPEPKPLPTGGAMGEDFIYVPGGFNPLYGTGRDQPYQLPGKYYKRTPQGLVPYNPFALAPGVRGFADGGQVGVAPPKNTPFAELALDPNVAATRSYIEELNRRARNPEVVAYPGVSGGLGGFNVPFTPPVDTGGGGGGDVGGGGGSLTGSPTGDLVAGLVGQELVRKGLEKGLGYVKDKFFPTEDPLAGLGSFATRPLIDPLAGVDVSSLPIPGGADLSTIGSTPNIAGGASSAGLAAIKARDLIDPLANVDVSKLPIPGELDLSKLGTTLPKADLTAKYAETAGTSGADAGGATSWFNKTGFDLSAPTSPVGYATAALGAYNTAKAIESGKEGKAALNAALTAAQFGGPLVALSAAAIAAIGASLVNTKEFGDKALENYWRAVDQGRGLGAAPPEELAQGFINFYRTNKNNFPGQEKYGRTGNEDFVYDMTQVINDAVKSGKIGKGADATTIYEQVVQPWLSSMGPGPQDADARRVQDFMMTDLIHNFMKGAPISNAQVKGDKNFKIVSERPVYAGTPPSDMQMYGQMPAGFQGRPDELRGIGRDEFRTPFSAPEEREFTMPTPFSEPQIVEEAAPTPYSPRIIEEEPAPPAPSPLRKTIPTPISVRPDSEAQREYIPTPFSEPEVIREPEPVYREPEPVYIPPVYREPEPVYRREYEMFSPFSEFGEGQELQFNYGGAVGEDYNFGFARGGMPNEYQAGGKLLDGPGDGMSDDIPAVIRGKGVQRAALADGEFVIPADVVSHLGNGSTKAGAKKLYDMMARVRQARTGRTKQAPAVKTTRLLPA